MSINTRTSKKNGRCGTVLWIVVIIILLNSIFSNINKGSEPETSDSVRVQTQTAEIPQEQIIQEQTIQEPQINADASTVLTNFANQYSYLSGTAGYQGYFIKMETQQIYSYNGSIPMMPVTCHMMDFDYDGIEELLLVTMNQDNTMCLMMYEAINGTAECVSVLNMPIPVAGSAENGLVDGILYEQNGRQMISFYENSSFGYLGDAQIIRFSAAYYDGNQLQSAGFAETIGSAGMDPEFENAMASMGLPVDLSALSRGDIGIRDYMINPLTFSECATYCTWTVDDWISYSDTWYNDSSVTSVQASIIEFR